ncbi:GSP1 [Symbiodinium natans]|uniref:GSP1 protein n=1 Tax=Symbiodinium natans TaxID=878477 RepID=A0A812N7Y9_9DINO|nr:GSP1 [Symbiodinium natans]
MSVVRLDEDDLDEEDLAILKEVAKKGYYHNRPKSESCAPPQRVEEVVRLDKSPEVKGRAAFDAFQAKWDRFDNEEYLEAMVDEVGQKFAAGTKNSTSSLNFAPPGSMRQHVAEFKILLIGEKAVGKTSFLLRHHTGEFARSGAAQDTEVVLLRFATTCGEIVFNVWELDPSAEERKFSQSQAAILMYDMGSRASWRNVPNFLRDVSKLCGTIPVVLVGNKSDVTQRKEQTRSARLAFQQKRRLQHFETSAKTCDNLEKPFWWLSRRLSGSPKLEMAAQRAIFPEAQLQPELFAKHRCEVAEAIRTPVPEDHELVFGLEDAKFTSDEVKEKVKVAQMTEAKINMVSENYRLVANRGSLLFFLMMELCKMHTFYKYSLDAFVMVVTRAVSLVTLRKVKEMFLFNASVGLFPRSPRGGDAAVMAGAGRDVANEGLEVAVEGRLVVQAGRATIFLHGVSGCPEPMTLGSLAGLILAGEVLLSIAEVPDEVLEARVENSLKVSVEDLFLATGRRYEPLFSQEQLESILEDHLAEREADAGWESPPRRAPSGSACTIRPDSSRPLCPFPDPFRCIDRLLPLIFQEVNHAMAFIHKQVEVLEAVAQVTGTSEWSSMPPLSGKAFASVSALEAVLGLCLGLLERTDFNPGLAACLMTPLGRKLQDAMLTLLGDHQKLTGEVNDMRWQLAAFRRLAHARYGLQWHADTALHIAAQAGWTLFHLAKLDGYFLRRFGLSSDSQESFEDAPPLLLQEPSEVDMKDVQTDWPLELRSALHSGGSLWHLDKGLLRFLLSNVLQKGDNVCDLGAFGGHYSEWLNDTGLVSAFAFDAIPGVEEITSGAVRYARLDADKLELAGVGCDVVLCLEVMEHISPATEHQALMNLGLHTKRALVLSWAPPWVPGPGHINQRPPAEAWDLVEIHTGLLRQPSLSAEAQASSSLSWVKESVAIFGWPEQ